MKKILNSDYFKAAWIILSFIGAMFFLIKTDDWASPGVEIAMVASIASFIAAITYTGQKRGA